MAQTVNRFSDQNGLYVLDTETGAYLPLDIKSFTTTSASVYSASVSGVSKPTVRFGLSSSYSFSAGDIILVGGISTSSISYLNTYHRVIGASVVGGNSVLSASPIIPLTWLNSSSAVTAINGTLDLKYSYDWISTNSALILSSENQSITQRYVFEVSPLLSSNADIAFGIYNRPTIVSDCGKRFQFNALVRPQSTVTVTTQLYIDNATSTQGRAETLFGGRYNAIRSNTVEIPDDGNTHTLSIVITVSGHSGQSIFLTSPNLIDDTMYYSNWFVRNARNFMPDFYWDLDFEQEYPIAPFHKLIDALMTVSGATRDKYNDFYSFEGGEIDKYIDAVEKYPNSTLVNPYYAEPEYLAWLMHFAGSKAKRNIIDSSGNKILPSTEAETNFLRWQAGTQSYGLRAGGKKALRSAAQQALAFTKNGNVSTYSVAVTPRYNNNAFSIRVQTLLNETPDVTVSGNSSQAVLDAIEQARPLGYKITHTTASAFYFTLGDETLGSLGQQSLSP